MAADQPKPRFEPPPWEQEAFERFRKEQEKTRAKEELEAALQAVRVPSGAGTQEVAEAPAVPEEAAMAPTAQPTDGPAAQPLPDAKVEAMLLELRQEELPAKPVNPALVNAVIVFMVTLGLYIIIRALLFTTSAQTGEAANTLLALTISLVVFVTGCGFLGGAYFLFRKYHR